MQAHCNLTTTVQEAQLIPSLQQIYGITAISNSLFVGGKHGEILHKGDKQATRNGCTLSYAPLTRCTLLRQMGYSEAKPYLETSCIALCPKTFDACLQSKAFAVLIATVAD